MHTYYAGQVRLCCLHGPLQRWHPSPWVPLLHSTLWSHMWPLRRNWQSTRTLAVTNYMSLNIYITYKRTMIYISKKWLNFSISLYFIFWDTGFNINGKNHSLVIGTTMLREQLYSCKLLREKKNCGSVSVGVAHLGWHFFEHILYPGRVYSFM